MNFYTFFKSETKKDCKFYNLEHPDFSVSLGFYRDNLLRLRFGISNLDISHFQKACYRVVPIGFPKSFYENLFDFFFSLVFRNNILCDDYDNINNYASKLTSELISIVEDK